MCDHDWINLAMADDSIVADLLLRLNRPLQLRWTVRQPRSRSVPRHSAAAAKPESTRDSPNTPLSWTAAATSASDESSLPTKRTQTSRSKVTNPKETVTTRNPKRKKTLPELKEEESLMFSERRNLKNELKSLRLIVEKERTVNENLKRLLDLKSQQNSSTENASLKVQEIDNQEPKFVIPDLNL